MNHDFLLPQLSPKRLVVYIVLTHGRCDIAVIRCLFPHPCECILLLIDLINLSIHKLVMQLISSGYFYAVQWFGKTIFCLHRAL